MIRTGIDLVETERIEKAVNGHDGFLARYFTDEECEYFSQKKTPYECIAGHFAAKEAFSKFLGSGVRGFALKDISISYDALGKPFILFKGSRIDADLSISHTKGAAVAVVCGEALNSSALPLEYAGYSSLLPNRASDANKGSCGKVFIIAGSKGMTGAACLSAAAALRTGSGLVTLGIPASEQPVAACKLTEAMTLPLPCDDGQLSASGIDMILNQAALSDVVVFGPGLGKGKAVEDILRQLLMQDRPLLIDADGINALSRNINILKERNCTAVLTPHPGEMSRLNDKTIADIQSSRTKTAADFAAEYGVVLTLKGANTVIAFPDGSVKLNPTGNSGMATGGTGDVLSGMIGSLIGQGCSVGDAAVLGVFLHGCAGDLAAADKGEYGMIATDIVENIPYAIKNLCMG